MRLVLCLILIGLPGLARADIDAVIDRHILPGHAAFADRTSALRAAATADCAPQRLVSAYHATFDAWMRISHIRFGPIEQDGTALAIAYWPDPKNSTGKALNRLIADADPAVRDAAAFREVSVAARGLFALERMLFDPGFSGGEDKAYACALTRAIAADLAETADTLNRDWISGHADILRHAGDVKNTVYLSEKEGIQTLYTSLSTGLLFLHDQRLGRPLGTFDRPRPRRSEARRSNRSLDNIRLSLQAMRQMTDTMTDGTAPQTLAAFDAALARAERIDDPALTGVADPARRFEIEVLQQHVELIRQTLTREVGGRLGISAGFNALDGD